MRQIKPNLLSEEDLKNVKMDIKSALKAIALSELVSMRELEEEIANTEKIYESPLLLGLMVRCVQNQNESAIEKLITGFAHWKNFLPQKELGGMTNVEYEKKYPRGPEELRIIGEMMKTYEAKLGDMSIKEAKETNFDIDKDFAEFQKEFLELIPAYQPFGTQKMLTHKEVIIKEREAIGVPRENIERIGVKIYAENVMEKMGDAIEKINEEYFDIMEEVENIRANPKKRDIKEVRKIFNALTDLEPFMKCTAQAPSFYNNFAGAAFLCDKDDLAIELLNKAITIDHNYEIAKQFLKRINKLK